MTDTSLTYLDAYCERAAQAGPWAEPVNLLTNLLFLVAAWALWRALSRHPQISAARRRFCLALAGLMAAIGLGSGAWHLMPSGDTVLMDVIPITLFIHVFLIAALREMLALRWAATGLCWLGYVALSVAAQLTLPPDLWHGTVMYLPTYVTLLVLSAAVFLRHRSVGMPMVGVCAVWTASLALRTADLPLCAANPLGTHFLWHTLNAWVLWRLSRLLLDSPARA